MKVDVAVLGSPSLIVPTDSVDVKENNELDISSELRSCIKVEVDVLGSPFLISLVVSVDVSNTETEGGGGEEEQ